MKQIQRLIIFGLAIFLFSCKNDGNVLNVVNSESFSEKQIVIDGQLKLRLLPDSFKNLINDYPFQDKLNAMIVTIDGLRKAKSDSVWLNLLANWDNFRLYHIGTDGLPIFHANELIDLVGNSETIAVAQKWIELNSKMLKFSGETRFGDVLENLLLNSKIQVFNESLLKSVVYTHIDDQIFINLIGFSSVNHYHTTGGTVKLIQETDYPAGNEMTLKCESDDIRFLDVFIRIPSWAVNPKVTHGNVKYVAHPGEYCEISRKWGNGDEIKVILKN